MRVPMKDVAGLKRERAALDAEIAERRRVARAKADEIAASERARAAEAPAVEALNAHLTVACEAYMTGTLVWRDWLVAFRPLYDRLARSAYDASDQIMGRHAFNGLLGAAFTRARDYERTR